MEPLHRFYRDNEGRLFGYLLHKSGDQQVAADLVQEAFTRYLEHYRHRGENVPLLFTIGRNLFYDHVRHQRHCGDYRDSAYRDNVCGQEERCAVRERVERVRQALKRLNEEERDILAMVVKSGLSYQQIAEIHGCSRGNIKIKIHRARQRLKRFMQEDGNA